MAYASFTYNTTLSGAIDRITGVDYPRTKIAWGAEGVATEVAAASPLPVDLVSAAVTNAGTFATQVDGAALTALQLIDDAIYADDADWTDSTSKHMLTGGLYQSTPQTVTDGDVAPFQSTVRGEIKAAIVNSSGVVQNPVAVAEDSAYAGGENAIPVLYVRDDAKNVRVGTDGDFGFASLNGVGDLRVDGGQVTYIDVTLTCDTSILAVGDVIADSQIIAACVRANDAAGVLHSIAMIDIDDQGTAVDLIFMKTSTSVGTENAAISISAANMALGYLGHVAIAAADYYDAINSQVVVKTNVGLAIEPATGTDDIYVAAVCRSGTPTYTASGLQLRLGFIAD